MKKIFLAFLFIISQATISCQIDDFENQSKSVKRPSSARRYPCDEVPGFPQSNDFYRTISTQSAYQMGWIHGSVSRGIAFEMREISIGSGYDIEKFTSGWEIPNLSTLDPWTSWLQHLLKDEVGKGKNVYFVRTTGTTKTAYIASAQYFNTIYQNGTNYLNSVGNDPLYVTAYWKGFADAPTGDYTCRLLWKYPNLEDPTGQTFIQESYLFPDIANLDINAGQEPW